ncbi:MAG: hypothetical protein ACJ8DN_01320, partial [Microvirga sp.]
ADVLLFVDYAEAQNQLAAIAAAIEAANAAGHRLRLVATCRASAVSTVLLYRPDLARQIGFPNPNDASAPIADLPEAALTSAASG